MNVKTMLSKSALPIAGATVAVGAAMGLAMLPRKRKKVQKTAGRALKAVGDAVEHFPNLLRM